MLCGILLYIAIYYNEIECNIIHRNTGGHLLVHCVILYRVMTLYGYIWELSNAPCPRNRSIAALSRILSRAYCTFMCSSFIHFFMWVFGRPPYVCIYTHVCKYISRVYYPATGLFFRYPNKTDPSNSMKRGPSQAEASDGWRISSASAGRFRRLHATTSRWEATYQDVLLGLKGPLI